MSSPTGHVASPTLNGTALVGAAPIEVGVRYREIKTVVESAHGAAREFLPYVGEGYPVRCRKRSFTIKWAHLRGIYDLVEDLLATAGPHALCLWKMEHLAYTCSGSRAEFFTPWPAAVLTLTPPHGLASALFEPAVKVALDGATLTYLEKTAVAYAGGTPEAGEVWFSDAGDRFKLEAAPAAGSVVYAHLCPLFPVYEAGEHEKKLTSPLREPRDLILLEA